MFKHVKLYSTQVPQLLILFLQRLNDLRPLKLRIKRP